MAQKRTALSGSPSRFASSCFASRPCAPRSAVSGSALNYHRDTDRVLMPLYCSHARPNLRFIDQPQITGLDQPLNSFCRSSSMNIAESGIIARLCILSGSFQYRITLRRVVILPDLELLVMLRSPSCLIMTGGRASETRRRVVDLLFGPVGKRSPRRRAPAFPLLEPSRRTRRPDKTKHKAGGGGSYACNGIFLCGSYGSLPGCCPADPWHCRRIPSVHLCWLRTGFGSGCVRR